MVARSKDCRVLLCAISPPYVKLRLQRQYRRDNRKTSRMNHTFLVASSLGVRDERQAFVEGAFRRPRHDRGSISEARQSPKVAVFRAGLLGPVADEKGRSAKYSRPDGVEGSSST